MECSCPKCHYEFRDLDDSLQGRPARCEICEHEFIIPFIDPELLLEWAENTSWDQLEEAMANQFAAGHSRRTISALVKIFEEQRFKEEWRIRRMTDCDTLTVRERKWRTSERKLLRHKSLERLRDFEVFKETVAETFKTQGYRTRILQRGERNGINIDILDLEGKRWAVVVCKIPTTESPVSPRHIRGFAGAFMLSGAEKGFFFTTGEFSKSAKETASQFPWLTIYDGRKLTDYIEE